MDGTDVWLHQPWGRPAVPHERTPASPWTRLDLGLPSSGVVHGEAPGHVGGRPRPVGVYFGTTSGRGLAATDDGTTWGRSSPTCLEIYSLEVADPVER